MLKTVGSVGGACQTETWCVCNHADAQLLHKSIRLAAVNAAQETCNAIHYSTASSGSSQRQIQDFCKGMPPFSCHELVPPPATRRSEVFFFLARDRCR